MSTENNNENFEHKFVKKDLGAIPESVVNIGAKEYIKEIEKSKKDKPIRIKKIIKSKNTEKEKEIDQKLMEIYENEDGSMPDMTHFQKEKRGRFLRSIFVLLFSCAFLVAVAWAGFFVIQPKSSFSEEDVVLSISGEEKVNIGEDMRYRIRYKNNQNVKLNNVILQVRYPEGFILTDSSRAASNEAKDEWLIGDLAEQESGFLDINGKMYGSVGENQSFRMFLNYKAENFSSEFQKVNNLTLEIGQFPVDLTVEGATEVVLGSEIELNVSLNNPDKYRLENLAIELDGGSAFSIKSSNPKSDQFVKNRWNVDPEIDQKFSIKGVFNPDLGMQTGDVTLRLIGWKDKDRSEDGFVYAEKVYLVNFLQTEVTANLVINGTSGNMSVQPGETLNGTVVLKNAGTTPLKNVTARVILDAPAYEKNSIFKWADIENPQDADIVGEQLNVEKRRGILTWNKSKIIDLRQVDSNEEITADFGLPIKSSEDADLTLYKGTEIEATLEVRYELNGENKIISSAPIKMTLNSDTDFEMRDEVSFVDGKNTYVIKWIVNNTFHELENIKIQTDIYGDIAWLEDQLSVPAGSVDFNKETQKLTWTIDKMPIGLDVLALQFAFTLNSNNPTQTNLTSKTTFEAKDTVTGEQILKAGKEIILNKAQ